MINKKNNSFLLFIFYTVLSIFLSYFIFKKEYLYSVGLLIISFFVVTFMYWNRFLEIASKIKIYSILKLLFWLTIITAITRSAFLNIPFGSYHLFLFRFILPLMLFLIALQILLNRGKIVFAFKQIKFYLLFLTVWFGYAILSLSWVSSMLPALKQIFFLFVGLILIILILLYLREQKDLKNFYILWLLLLVFLVGIGLWEMFSGHRLSSSGYFDTEWANKKIWPTATFHNTNDFASFLALSIPFIWGWLRYGKKRILKWLICFPLLIGGLFLLIKTMSRLNYLAVLLEIIFITICFLKTNKKIKGVGIVGLIIVLILIFYFQLHLKLFEFLKQFTPYTITHTSSSGIARLAVIKNCLSGLFDSYGFGVGAGNIEFHIAHFARYPIINGILAPHNWWIEILANYGIFIFIGYLLFYLKLVYNFWNMWRNINNPWDKMLCETLLIFLIGFSISSIGPSSIMELSYQWILFGFTLAFLNYYRIHYSKTKITKAI